MGSRRWPADLPLWPRSSTLLAPRLAQQLPTGPLDRPVGMFAHVLPLDRCLLTRLVELVVHFDDLAVSL
ncbi:hypothetical protein OG607_44125 [Streptomyces sp. NBC_01537]|uniref:hypothetical protein n=1 Tax=Streptomyces sp. NBC_01537 TaxID=2903896 RepID=UPI003865AAF9